MVNPCPGRSITTPFKKKGSAWATGEHSGVDWACPTGTTVVAPWGGTVVGAGGGGGGWGSAYGNAVVIDFDRLPDGSAGLWGVLAHMSRVDVRAGQRVEAGQHIGKSGNTGNSTGPHLHFEVQPQRGWVKGSYRDPQRWIDAGTTAPTKPQQWQFPNGHKVYAKYLKVNGHELNADGVSNSIAAWQEMLNRHSMPGGTTLPITGKYWQATDRETILCQRLHLPPEDPAMKSYVGPKQWQHLKEATGCPYEFVPDTAPPTAPTPPPTTTDRWVHGDAWRPAPSLVALRDEVDARWPDRSRVSDGTIGDAAHSTSKSEHNPVGHKYGPEFGTVGTVHAIDITVAGTDPQKILDAAIGDPRVWYVIHNGSIWSKTHGWKKNPYNGSNPHTTHIHVSLAADDQASAVKNEQDTSPWLEIPPLPEPEPPLVEQIPAWLEEFIRSNWAPILIIAVGVALALAVLGLA